MQSTSLNIDSVCLSWSPQPRPPGLRPTFNQITPNQRRLAATEWPLSGWEETYEMLSEWLQDLYALIKWVCHFYILDIQYYMLNILYHLHHTFLTWCSEPSHDQQTFSVHFRSLTMTHNGVETTGSVQIPQNQTKPQKHYTKPPKDYTKPPKDYTKTRHIRRNPMILNKNPKCSTRVSTNIKSTQNIKYQILRDSIIK